MRENIYNSRGYISVGNELELEDGETWLQYKLRFSAMRYARNVNKKMVEYGKKK